MTAGEATAGAGGAGTGPPHRRRDATFWVSAAVGWAVIGVALWQIVDRSRDTRPGQLAAFVLGGALVHDLLVVPAVLAVGAGLARVPGPARRWAQAGLAIAAVVALFAYPLVRGFAHVLANPTSLPRNYTVGVLVVVGAAWAGLALAAATAHLLSGRRRPTPAPRGGRRRLRRPNRSPSR